VALVLGLFVATVVAELGVPLRSSGGFVCGMLATLFGMTHAAYAYPPWRRALLALKG